MWRALLGGAILIGGTIDLVWTALGTHGGGPLSAPFTKLIWNSAKAAHRRWPQHRTLSFAGSVILLSMLTLWVALAWAGWTFIFTATPTALVDAKTRVPAPLVARIFFVGATMFTSGTSEYAPTGGAWHIASALAAGWGLFVVTISITYIVAVLGAAVSKRSLAAFIWDMGATPERIIARAWNGHEFDDLSNHLTELITSVEKFGEQHLAYPILQYFHSETRRTAASLRLAALYETLLLLDKGTAEEVRPPKLLLHTARDAIRGFSEVIADEFVKAAKEPPPWPDLGILAAHGIPSRPLAEFGAAVDEVSDIRRRLLGMVTDAGWRWSDVASMGLNPD